MSAQNKAAMRSLYEEVWNQGKFEVLDQVVSPDYVGHLPTPPNAPSGRGQGTTSRTRHSRPWW